MPHPKRPREDETAEERVRQIEGQARARIREALGVEAIA